MSALSLGTLGHRAKDNNKVLTEDNASLLSDEMKKAKEKNEKRTLQLAMGNTGSLKNIEDLAKFKNDKDEELRANAIESLLNMKEGSEDVFDMLSDALNTDVSSFVRKTALEVLSTRKPSEKKLQFIINHLN